MSIKPWLYPRLMDLRYVSEFGEGSWRTWRLELGSYKLETEVPRPTLGNSLCCRDSSHLYYSGWRGFSSLLSLPSFLFFFLGHSALKPGWMVHLSQSRGTRRHPNSIWTHCNHPVPSMSSLCVHLGEEEGVWVKTWPSPTLSSQAQPHVHGAMSLLLPNHPSPDFSQGRTCCPGCTSLPFQE